MDTLQIEVCIRWALNIYIELHRALYMKQS